MHTKPMQALVFKARGEYFIALPTGELTQYSPSPRFSGNWLLLGGSTHHWHRRVTVPLADIFRDPARFIGCYVWDTDHGTTRTWRGPAPRVTDAYLTTAP